MVLSKIDYNAFRDNSLTGTLTLPNSVTYVGSAAFRFNTLQTVYLGSNITVVGYDAFMDNSVNDVNTLTDIYIDMTESTWNSTVKAGPEVQSPPTQWKDDSTTAHFNQS